MCLILLQNHGAKDLLSNVHSTVQLLQLFQIDGLWCVGYWTYSETIVLKGRIFYSMKTINNGRKAIMEYPNLKLVITTLLQMNLKSFLLANMEMEYIMPYSLFTLNILFAIGIMKLSDISFYCEHLWNIKEPIQSLLIQRKKRNGITRTNHMNKIAIMTKSFTADLPLDIFCHILCFLI